MADFRKSVGGYADFSKIDLPTTTILVSKIIPLLAKMLNALPSSLRLQFVTLGVGQFCVQDHFQREKDILALPSSTALLMAVIPLAPAPIMATVFLLLISESLFLSTSTASLLLSVAFLHLLPLAAAAVTVTQQQQQQQQWVIRGCLLLFWSRALRWSQAEQIG